MNIVNPLRTADTALPLMAELPGAGATAEIRRLAGPRTESVNLRGRTVLPGVNDSHLIAESTTNERKKPRSNTGLP